MEIVGTGADFIKALESVGIDPERVARVKKQFAAWGDRLTSVRMVNGEVLCEVEPDADV